MAKRWSGRPGALSWQAGLVHWVSGLLLFETISGLAIWLLPFSVPNQLMVFVHTGAGVVCLIPCAVYLTRHWLTYRRWSLSHVVLTGYFASVATIVALVSGVILTFQALFGTRISYGWDLVHIGATLALVASLLPHILLIVGRVVRSATEAARQPIVTAFRRYTAASTYVCLGLFAVVALGFFTYEPVELENRLPADYSYLYGPDRPFAPSLARTRSGGALDARSLGNSESCGTSGCHEQIVEEWKVSAHRYSAMDVAFQAVQQVMAEQNGPESTRYCGGCHDPISLFSGAKNLFAEDLTHLVGYQEGVSCIVCHAIRETDLQGNANYVIDPPDRYMFELREGRTARFFRDFLIRAYPRYHVESLQHRLFKSPEFCAACHKQFIDEEINKVGWVQLQNQYDNWRKSRWNEPGDPTKTIECRECHMRLIDSRDPAAGDPLDYNRSTEDEKHRSHRFLASNQFMPVLLELEGAAEHTALTEKWLRGEIEIPEIADKWRSGPAVPIELVAPATVDPGQEVKIQAVITNNKVGHDFPTGPLDLIQAWVEIVITDQAGRVLFESGKRDDRYFIQPGSFMFKAEPVDQYGNLIDRHNLWEMVGVRYRRSLFPGTSDRAQYTFVCPATLVPGPAEGRRTPMTEEAELRVPEAGVRSLQVSARLLYRKVDQYLLNFLFGEDSGLTAPTTVMSEAESTIRVGDA